MHDALREFITSELLGNPSYPLTNDEPLITGGLIDSFSLTQVGIFIEEQYGIRLPDPIMTVANMDTIDQIVALVQSRQ